MIVWGQLKHACGSAEDLPALVAAVGSSDPAAAAEALHALAQRIHQHGTIYEATSYIVPSLVALATSPRCALRVRVLRVLGSLACRADDQQGLGVALFAIEPALVGLLGDDDAQVRAASVAVLARVPTIADETRATLESYDDDDARVRFGLALTLGRISVLAEALLHPERIAWLPVSGEEPRTAALQALARLVPTRGDEVAEALLPVFDARPAADVMAVLVRASITPAVLRRLSSTQLWTSGALAPELQGVLRALGLPTSRAALTSAAGRPAGSSG